MKLFFFCINRQNRQEKLQMIIGAEVGLHQKMKMIMAYWKSDHDIAIRKGQQHIVKRMILKMNISQDLAKIRVL